MRAVCRLLLATFGFDSTALAQTALVPPRAAAPSRPGVVEDRTIPPSANESSAAVVSPMDRARAASGNRRAVTTAHRPTPVPEVERNAAALPGRLAVLPKSASGEPASAPAAPPTLRLPAATTPAVIEVGGASALDADPGGGGAGAVAATDITTAEHAFPAGWSLVSVPLSVSNGAPSSVFDEVPAPLRLYDYVNGQVLASDEAGFRNVVPGRAYWMLLGAATTVRASGQPVAMSAAYSIAIKPGWNAIATPWFSAVEWSDVQVSVRNGTSTRALGAAVADGWIEGTLDDPDPAGAYATIAANASPAGRLLPWHGYLLFSNITGDLVFAAPPADTTPPDVSFGGTLDGSVITQPTDIVGSVGDANLVQWRLEYAPAGGGAFTTLGSGDAPVVDGVLGTLDPTLLLNGLYLVRLTATDVSGTPSGLTVTVAVQGNQKVGNFTVSFLDLEVPLAGLPIRVNRTYDSRDKRGGDFGVGWRIDLSNLRVDESGILGRGWEGTRSGGLFPSYCNRPVGAHIVSITFPDNTVYEFEPVTDPECQVLFPPTFVTVGFRPRPGTVATLEPLDASSVLAPGPWPGTFDLLDDSTLETWDPNLYKLTMPDGRAFVIHQQQGLQSITDLNGNQLMVGPNGIVHSSGRGIAFTRDGLSRITSITDPAGNVMTYAYDASGDLVASADREEKTTTYEYDGSHGLLAIHDPRGLQPVRSDYDAAGRLFRVTDALGNVMEYSHDVAGRREVVRDRVGRVSVLEYDDRGNVIVQTDPDGTVIHRTFDARDNKLTETNPLGQTTTYTYDAQDNVTSITDALGQVTSFTYNARGQELTKRDPRGGVGTSAYDAKGNLTSFVDPAGKTTTYTYDARGNLSTVTDPVGCVTRYESDLAGNLVKQVDALGHETTYTYDANGLRLTETRTRTRNGVPETLLTTFTYDRMGRVVEKTRPDGGVEASEYDDAGRLAATVDALGRRTTFTYDDMGRLVRTLHPDGTSEESAFDGEGRPLSSTDRAGRVTSFENDGLGRVTRTTYPDGAVVANAYDAAGRPVAVTDTRGNITRYEYDAAGRKLKVTDPAGRSTTFTYDASGNQVSLRDANGNTTTSEYDAMNRRIRVVLADGKDRKATFDGMGRLLTETDQAGRTTQFTYDCLGQLTRVTDALGQATNYQYDEVGNRIAQTDAGGRTTAFDFDELAREVRRTLPTGKSQARTYDPAGNLLSRTLYGGATVSYSYDAADRLVTRSYPDGSSLSFTYTSTGQRATVTDARGTTRYEYDRRDRLTRLQQPDAGVLEYEYDAQGNRTRLRASSGGISYASTYAYDASGRLTTVTDPQGRTYSIGYDPSGNRTSLAYPNGTLTTYQYDPLNRLTSLSAARGRSAFQSYAYTLGPTGIRTRIDEGGGTSRAYTYDALYRLTQETVAGGLAYTKSFTYDPVGNRLTQTDSRTGAIGYTYDDGDRLLTESAATYSWDDDGGLSSRSGLEGASYVWDHEQRLIQVTKGDGTIVTHAYDADGNRVRTDVTPSTGPPPFSTRFLVDPSGALSHVALETDPSGAPRAFYLRADDLLAVIRPSGTRFFHADGLGSIRALTDEAGIVTDQYAYSAFGELLSHTGSDPNPYQFAGEPLDPNSGFYYNRARWLDTRVGRFISSDPLDGVPNDPASLHRYLYAHADPVNRVDPTGLFGDFSIGGLATSMAIGATINAIASINPQTTFQSFALAALEGAVQGAAFYVAGALAARLAWRVATATRALQVGRFPLVGRASPIAPYNVLQEVTAGHRGAIQAHHILEVRHLRAWGFSAAEIAAAPAQVLTQAEHAVVSAELSTLLPTGVRYTREAVWRAYQIAYRNYPQYLQAIERYFF